MEKYFYEAFSGMDRLGPGSAASTKRAADLLSVPPAECGGWNILDIGCGKGAHTMILAERFPDAEITAIDIHLPYIEKLNETAEKRGFSERVRGTVMSMFEMSFADESFDLIWSEGSVYIPGFTGGIRDWKRLLKKGGYLACSEISWLTENPSEASRAFWEAGYPQIDTISGKIRQIQKAGYEIRDWFICPVSDWTGYYDSIEKNLKNMSERYSTGGAGAEQATAVVRSLREEISLYRTHPEDYSYVFYIMKK